MREKDYGGVIAGISEYARSKKKLPTITDLSKPYDADAISTNPGRSPDEQGMVNVPNLNMARRHQDPNPKKEL